MPSKLAGNKRVTKAAREQAAALASPQFDQDDDLPFRRALIVPISTVKRESFQAPSGRTITDETTSPDCGSIQVALSKPVLTKDNMFGHEEKIYVFKLPCRTDVNQAVRDGFKSEDIVRALIVDPSYGLFFDLLEVTNEDSRDLARLGRDRAARTEIEARKKVLSENPLLAVNAVDGVSAIAMPEVNLPQE